MSSPQWRFADFRLDPANACLWRGTQRMALTPKAFDVLHYLVTHADRLVSKDTLLDAVWPETAISDAVVRIAIGELRRALGDTAQAPRFIATVHRRGYRFVAPVVEHTEEVPIPAALEMPTTPQTRAAGSSETPALPPDRPAVSPHPRVLPFSDTLVPPEAERRPLTVLFCDLVDSTRLASRLDPEDFRDVVRAYHQTCTEVIQRFDGYVAQYLGDGLLVYFGYPMAHEDDAQRAVWTGLGILEALTPLTAQLALSPGEHIAVRLGVHTGLVVMGNVGAGTRHEPLALGETPSIAARLQALAAPNTLVISAATHQRIAGYFTCEVLGEPPLRGLEQPLRVYRVLRPSGVQSRLEVAAARGLTPLVGRTSEVEILRERWTRVKAGMGQAVVLEGEAGIGKSRLVQVLKDHVAHEAHLCWECRGVPYYQHTALYPITACLQRWLQWQPGAASAAALAQLEALLTRAQLALEETVPVLADLVTLPLPAERYPPRLLLSEQQRQRTFDVLLALVGGLAEQQPVLVIVEDLHWVDPSTLELLGLLLDQVPTTRIYTVLTCRPEFQAPWGFRTHLTPLALNRLTLSQAEAMIEEVLGAQRLPEAARAQIVAQTDGIPLFVEEVTKAVLDAGRSLNMQTLDAVSGLGPALAIPVTLHEALLARLDRLGSAKSIAQLGATIGREFTYGLLQAVAPLKDEALQRDLAVLVAAELLYQRGQPPRALYRFKHALIQEAAYESVLRSVRRQTHQRILHVLEAQLPETMATQPALLAHHALRGERWDQAVAYFQQAGEQALARSAYREAVTAFEQALGALQHLPDSRDTHELAIDLRLALRGALYPLGEFRQILVYLQDAAALAAALGDLYRLGWVAAYLTAHFALTCEPDPALESGHRALAIAADLGDIGLTVTAQYYLGHTYRYLGNYHRAVECYRKNVACLHGALRQERFGLPGLAAVVSRSLLAVSLAECGIFPEGMTLTEEGSQIAKTADHPYSHLLVYWAVGFRSLHQGNLPQAIPVLEQAIHCAQEAHIRFVVTRLGALLGAAYALAGRTAEALPLLEQAVEQAMAIPIMIDQALWMVWLGEAYLCAGRLDEADIQAQRALEFSRVHQARGHTAYALRLLGEMAAQRTPPAAEQAETYYRQALALTEALGMRPLQAHCHRGLGMLYRQMGRLEEARAALATAIDMYRTMEMTFWLPQAEAVLAQAQQDRVRG
jgi:class 3 adenylate cyclase/DNA-binding winged helix-turn-helix (wHTH) protein/tetratricopeptide (TPR) repeat protein